MRRPYERDIEKTTQFAWKIYWQHGVGKSKSLKFCWSPAMSDNLQYRHGWQTRWHGSQRNWGRISNRSRSRANLVFQVSTWSSRHPSLHNLCKRSCSLLSTSQGGKLQCRNLPWQEQEEMHDWPRRYFPYSSKRNRHGEATGSTDCLLCSSCGSPSIFNCLVEAFRKSNIKEKECKYYGFKDISPSPSAKICLSVKALRGS